MAGKQGTVQSGEFGPESSVRVAGWGWTARSGRPEIHYSQAGSTTGRCAQSHLRDFRLWRYMRPGTGVPSGCIPSGES